MPPVSRKVEKKKENITVNSVTTDSHKALNIAFIHPDLGIGGAERLIVDAAMALQSTNNNKITIYTSHCDKSHCFEEVKQELLDVHVYGDFLPTNINGKFNIVFAFLRQLYLSLHLILSFKIFSYDIIILDQLSYCIPILHLFAWNTKILFYCHFPDKLLAPHTSKIRSIYRFVFDTIEEISTLYADKIVVNSEFTKSVVRKTFKLLDNKSLDVVYPCVSTDESQFKPTSKSLELLKTLLYNKSYFLSVNRFERKKNIQLAIDSFAAYLSKNKNISTQSLVIAGGYDPRVAENVEYLNQLKIRCDELNLTYQVFNNPDSANVTAVEAVSNVIFLTSISTGLKNALMSKCDLLIYTPSNEHFGIVPIEAMCMGKLVLADNSGGPLETIINFHDNKNTFTGFTIEADSDKWENVLEKVKNFSPPDLQEISKRCKSRVDEKFSSIALRTQLVKVINEMLSQKPRHSTAEHIAAPLLSFALIFYIYNYVLA
ncbi:Alpha-1,3-mannosyltransferase-like protein [Pichia californica]|nr:Alpha-1,3-mannosyltransferase-like protein [[Candida] californica]